MLRRKGKNRKKLQYKDRLDIAHKILVQNEKVMDVVKEYHISSAWVFIMINKVWKSKSIFDEIHQKEIDKKDKQLCIKTVVTKLNENDSIIDSADMIKE